MLGNVALVLLTLLLLQLLLAVAWRYAGDALELSPRTSRQWQLSTLLGALALALCLARGSVPDWLGYGLAICVLMASLLLMRRGLLTFLHQPLHDLESMLVLAATVAVEVAAIWLPAANGRPLHVLGPCCGLIWVLARSVWLAWPAMRSEFGERRSFALLSPLIGGCALFALRLVGSLLVPQQAGQPLQMDTPFNVAVAMVVLLLCLTIHGGLAAMVLLRVVGKLRHLSQRDALTGLLNRAEWMRQLQAQHRWLGRYGDPFGVMMLDIDHFKRINDTLGHPAGDAVLVAVAQVLTASARELDVIGRLGGEEFGVLLPRTEPVAARRAAERLRQMLADTEIRWKQQPLRVTVSIGVALATDADESPGQLLERVDRALYQAKHGGRNRTVVARLAG